MRISFIDYPVRSPLFAVPSELLGILRSLMNRDGYKTDTINPYNVLNLNNSYDIENGMYNEPAQNRDEVISRMLLKFYLLQTDTTSPIWDSISSEVGNIIEVSKILQSWCNYIGIGDGNIYDETIIDEGLKCFKPFISHINNTDIFFFDIHTSILPKSILSKMIKIEYPDKKIIWVGNQMIYKSATRAYIENDLCDIIINNFPEQTINALINATESGKSLHEIENITFKSDNNIIQTKEVYVKNEFTGLIPIYDGYMEKDKLRILPMKLALGCPYRCPYCAFKWSPFKKIDIETSISTISGLLKNWNNIHTLAPTDMALNADSKFLYEWCDKWITHCNSEDITMPSIGGFCNAVESNWNSDLIEKMKLSGINIVTLGIETLDPIKQSMWLSSQKSYSKEWVISLINSLLKNDIDVDHCYILGFPGDDKHDIYAEIERITEVMNATKYRATPYITALRATEESQLVKHPERFKIKAKYTNEYFDYFYTCLRDYTFKYVNINTEIPVTGGSNRRWVSSPPTLTEDAGVIAHHYHNLFQNKIVR